MCAVFLKLEIFSYFDAPFGATVHNDVDDDENELVIFVSPFKITQWNVLRVFK